MDRQTAFERQDSIGKQGEKAVAETLTKRGWEVVDVRNSRNYQQQDIDFRIFRNGNPGLSVEVKTDSYISTTGNIALEIEDNSTPATNGLGWFQYTQADILIYVCRYTHHMWAFSTEDLRQYIADVKHEPKVSCLYGNRVANLLVNIEAFKAAGYTVQELNTEQLN